MLQLILVVRTTEQRSLIFTCRAMTFTCSDWRVSYDAVASQSHLTLSPLSRTQNVEKQPLLLGNTEYLTLSTHM